MSFPWAQALATGVQLLGQQRAASQISNAERAQLGAQFDAFAGQVTEAFNVVTRQAVITEADYANLLALYNQLEKIVESYGPSVPYIQEQWNLPSYKAGYQFGLQDIGARVTHGSSAPVYVAGSTSDPAGDGNSNAQPAASVVPGISNTILIAGGAVLVGWLLFKN